MPEQLTLFVRYTRLYVVTASKTPFKAVERMCWQKWGHGSYRLTQETIWQGNDQELQ